MVNCLLLVCSLIMAGMVLATFGAGAALFLAARRGDLDLRNKTSDLDLPEDLPDISDLLPETQSLETNGTTAESLMNTTEHMLMEELNTSIEEKLNDTSMEDKLNDTLTDFFPSNDTSTITEKMMDTSTGTMIQNETASTPAKENLKVPMLRWEHPSLEWKEPVELKDASLEFKDSSLEWKDSQGTPMNWNRLVGFR